jgi:hypothetical protein
MRDTIEEAIVGLRRRMDDTDAPGGGGAGEGAAGSGSPSKRQRRAEESKFLSWETVQALFTSPALAEEPATEACEG